MIRKLFGSNQKELVSQDLNSPASTTNILMADHTVTFMAVEFSKEDIILMR